MLINGGCRCPNNQYTSTDNWGKCKDYLLSGLVSRLDMEWEIHQHQNNSFTVFVRFRAK